MAVQIGAYTGPAQAGAAARAAWTTSMGKPPAAQVDFVPGDNTATGASNWLSYQWQIAGLKGAQLRPAVPLTVVGTSLAQVAAGALDGMFSIILSDYKTKGFTGAVIRLGKECNIQADPWSAIGHDADFAAAFNHVAPMIRNAGMLTCFNVLAGWFDINYSAFAPNPSMIDRASMDVYPVCWGVNNPNEGDALASQYHNYALDFAAYFAGTVCGGKPLDVDEWGVGDRPNGTANYGPGDSPAVMQGLLDAFDKLNVDTACYWAFDGGNYNSSVLGGERPNEAAVLRRYIGAAEPDNAALMAEMQQIAAAIGNPTVPGPSS